jgi:hypothetical protein
MPGLLQRETFFNSSTVTPVVLRKTKRMLKKTEKQGGNSSFLQVAMF